MLGGSLVVDSTFRFAGAVAGTEAPPEVIADLALVTVRYCGFDGQSHEGQLIVHRDLTREIREIFALFEAQRFPVSHCIPIARYGWSDEASMAADNTSAFNYRFVAGTQRLSLHALGRAIDINPFRNPVLYPDGRLVPSGADYRPGAPGVFMDGDPAVRLFVALGWRWGGHFTHCQDRHHFEKPGG